MSGLMSLLSPILAGAAGAVGVSMLARRGLAAKPDRHGWRHIRPSAMHWTALGGSAGFASLVLYIRLFVGSARADAETQMMWANLIVAGFTICVVVSWWTIRRINRANVHWRGATLNFTEADGRERVKALTEVCAMDRRWTGTIAVTFMDGTTLNLDQYAQGVPELCGRITEVNGGPAFDDPMA